MYIPIPPLPALVSIRVQNALHEERANKQYHTILLHFPGKLLQYVRFTSESVCPIRGLFVPSLSWKMDWITLA
jgi:hypothetical protein